MTNSTPSSTVSSSEEVAQKIADIILEIKDALKASAVCLSYDKPWQECECRCEVQEELERQLEQRFKERIAYKYPDVVWASRPMTLRDSSCVTRRGTCAPIERTLEEFRVGNHVVVFALEWERFSTQTIQVYVEDIVELYGPYSQEVARRLCCFPRYKICKYVSPLSPEECPPRVINICREMPHLSSCRDSSDP